MSSFYKTEKSFIFFAKKNIVFRINRKNAYSFLKFNFY